MYGALSDLLPEIDPRVDRLELAITAGSNGTVMAAKAAREIAGLRPWLLRITLVDGRALAADVIQLVEALGGDKLTIIVNHGDFLAPLNSIGSLVGALTVQKKADGTVTVLLAGLKTLNPLMWTPLTNHISPMARGNASFEVSQFLKDGSSRKLGLLTGASLLQFRPEGTPDKYLRPSGAVANATVEPSGEPVIDALAPEGCSATGSGFRCPPPTGHLGLPPGGPGPSPVPIPPEGCSGLGSSGPCGPPPAGIAREMVDPASAPPAPVGGISIGRTAVWSGPLPPLVGARIDATNGRLVLLGGAQLTPGGVNLADLARALDLAERGEEVQFTLDPADPRNPSGPKLRAIYYPSDLIGTGYGDSLFTADFFLKELSFHVLVDETGHVRQRTTPVVPGFESEAEMVLNEWKAEPRAGGLPGTLGNSGRIADSAPRWARAWIIADTVILRRSGATIDFNVKMAVNARRTMPDPAAPSGLKDIPTDPDNVESRWARHATAHFSELAETIPSFHRLEEITKAIALAKFLKQQGVQIDRAQLRPYLAADRAPAITGVDAISFTHHRPYQIRTETSDQVVIVSVDHQLHLFGGVDLTVQPRVEAGDRMLAGLDARLRDGLTRVEGGPHAGRLEYTGRQMRVFLLPWLLRPASTER